MTSTPRSFDYLDDLEKKYPNPIVPDMYRMKEVITEPFPVNATGDRQWAGDRIGISEEDWKSFMRYYGGTDKPINPADWGFVGPHVFGEGMKSPHPTHTMEELGSDWASVELSKHINEPWNWLDSIGVYIDKGIHDSKDTIKDWTRRAALHAVDVSKTGGSIPWVAREFHDWWTGYKTPEEIIYEEGHVWSAVTKNPYMLPRTVQGNLSEWTGILEYYNKNTELGIEHLNAMTPQRIDINGLMREDKNVTGWRERLESINIHHQNEFRNRLASPEIYNDYRKSGWQGTLRASEEFGDYQPTVERAVNHVLGLSWNVTRDLEANWWAGAERIVGELDKLGMNVSTRDVIAKRLGRIKAFTDDKSIEDLPFDTYMKQKTGLQNELDEIRTLLEVTDPTPQTTYILDELDRLENLIEVGNMASHFVGFPSVEPDSLLIKAEEETKRRLFAIDEGTDHARKLVWYRNWADRVDTTWWDAAPGEWRSGLRERILEAMEVHLNVDSMDYWQRQTMERDIGIYFPQRPESISEDKWNRMSDEDKKRNDAAPLPIQTMPSDIVDERILDQITDEVAMLIGEYGFIPSDAITSTLEAIFEHPSVLNTTKKNPTLFNGDANSAQWAWAAWDNIEEARRFQKFDEPRLDSPADWKILTDAEGNVVEKGKAIMGHMREHKARILRGRAMADTISRFAENTKQWATDFHANFKRFRMTRALDKMANTGLFSQEDIRSLIPAIQGIEEWPSEELRDAYHNAIASSEEMDFGPGVSEAGWDDLKRFWSNRYIQSEDSKTFQAALDGSLNNSLANGARFMNRVRSGVSKIQQEITQAVMKTAKERERKLKSAGLVLKDVLQDGKLPPNPTPDDLELNAQSKMATVRSIVDQFETLALSGSEVPPDVEGVSDEFEWKRYRRKQILNIATILKHAGLISEDLDVNKIADDREVATRFFNEWNQTLPSWQDMQAAKIRYLKEINDPMFAFRTNVAAIVNEFGDSSITTYAQARDKALDMLNRPAAYSQDERIRYFQVFNGAMKGLKDLIPEEPKTTATDTLAGQVINHHLNPSPSQTTDAGNTALVAFQDQPHSRAGHPLLDASARMMQDSYNEILMNILRSDTGPLAGLENPQPLDISDPNSIFQKRPDGSFSYNLDTMNPTQQITTIATLMKYHTDRGVKLEGSKTMVPIKNFIQDGIGILNKGDLVTNLNSPDPELQEQGWRDLQRAVVALHAVNFLAGGLHNLDNKTTTAKEEEIYKWLGLEEPQWDRFKTGLTALFTIERNPGAHSSHAFSFRNVLTSLSEFIEVEHGGKITKENRSAAISEFTALMTRAEQFLVKTLGTAISGGSGLDVKANPNDVLEFVDSMVWGGTSGWFDEPISHSSRTFTEGWNWFIRPNLTPLFEQGILSDRAMIMDQLVKRQEDFKNSVEILRAAGFRFPTTQAEALKLFKELNDRRGYLSADEMEQMQLDFAGGEAWYNEGGDWEESDWTDMGVGPGVNSMIWWALAQELKTPESRRKFTSMVTAVANERENTGVTVDIKYLMNFLVHGKPRIIGRAWDEQGNSMAFPAHPNGPTPEMINEFLISSHPRSYEKGLYNLPDQLGSFLDQRLPTIGITTPGLRWSKEGSRRYPDMLGREAHPQAGEYLEPPAPIILSRSFSDSVNPGINQAIFSMADGDKIKAQRLKDLLMLHADGVWEEYQGWITSPQGREEHEAGENTGPTFTDLYLNVLWRFFKDAEKEGVTNPSLFGANLLSGSVFPDHRAKKGFSGELDKNYYPRLILDADQDLLARRSEMIAKGQHQLMRFHSMKLIASLPTEMNPNYTFSIVSTGTDDRGDGRRVPEGTNIIPAFYLDLSPAKEGESR